MKKFKEIYEPYILRPVIYMTFTRFVLALFITLLADFFISGNSNDSIKEILFIICAFLFLILAVIAWLRLDGMHLPQFMMMRVNPAKKPSRMYGDMIDYIDERPGINFNELDDSEKDLCILIANIFCFLVFLVLSIIF